VRFWAAPGIVVTVLALCASAAMAAGPQARATRVGPAPAGQRLQLVLLLKADLAGLEGFARAVTTPGSPQYGHYRTIGALAGRFGATAGTRARVATYLRSVGATDVKLDATGLFADATMTSRLAAALFHTPLAVFHSARQSRFVAPTAAARVPSALRGLVSGVVGLDTRRLASARSAGASGSAPAPAHAGSAPAPAHAGSTPAPAHVASQRSAAPPRAHAASQPSSALPLSGSQGGCPDGVAAGGFTPSQYLTAYGLSPLLSAGVRGQGERVALIEIDGFRSSDIATFASCFELDVPRLNGFGVGIKHELPPGGESTLDLEVLDAAAPDLNAIDVYETKPSAVDTLKALTAPLQNKGFKPQVISASLGLCEPDVLLAVGVHGLRIVEGALQMAAASGITFLSSSGDQGSADCVGLDGAPIDRLAVNYPSSSPWATGVGGTNLILGTTNQIAGQVVWNDTSVEPGAAGGGGASMLFTRPSYQKGTVARNVRFVPDVAMLADIVPGYAVYCSAPGDCVNSMSSNPWQTVGGTSAATPLLAGGLALVDQELRMNGRPDVGLVNPLLYMIGRSAALRLHVFSDVLSFGNDVGPFIPGNHRPLGCCTAGSGYDRASGWGSVDLQGLAAVAVLLTPPRVGLSLPRPQHPVRRQAVLATVSCSAACRAGAFADVKIGSGKPFRISSRLVSLAEADKATVPVPFGAKHLRQLRAALSHHRSISATVFGAVYGAGAHVTRRTSGKKLAIG
jgi:subtilase family serine protease